MTEARENGGANGRARPGEGPGRAESLAKPIHKRPRVVTLEHADVTGPEFTTRRSFSIQDGIQRFLEENTPSAWRTLDELYVRAANAVWHYGFLKRRPSSVTARRWVQQYTAVGEKYDLHEVEGEGYWLLDWRGNGGARP